LGFVGVLSVLSPSCYKVLIVGCGNIAGGFDMVRTPDLPPLSHAGAYSRHGGFSLQACVDPNQSRREEFARHWGVKSSGADMAGLNAAQGAFDVISICSPTQMHHEHLEQALALRPRVIFCEKPLTTDEVDAERLVEACRSQGVTLVVNYSRRWDPAVAELVSQLHEGRWGRVRSVVGHYNKGINNNGGHMLDLMMRLLGSLDVVATFHAEFDFWESDPTVAALLSAAEATIPVYLNPGNAQDFSYFELEIVCELGVIKMLSGGMVWQYREAVPSAEFIGYKSLNAVSQVGGRYMDAMANAIEDIHHHLISGESVGSTGENALRVQKLCMQIQREALAKCVSRN
jgi:predicted dehydrogenase